MAHMLQRLMRLPTKLNKNFSNVPHIHRSLMTGKCLKGNYEGDGKTIVTILNREYKHLIMIDTYSSLGFRLNNGIFVLGPMAVFPRTVLQWNINSISELTPESLSLFCLLEPKLDILIIGSGDKRELPSKEVLDYLKANKIVAEILPTEQASATFNFLNVEGRCVAGAFVPPTKVTIYEEEIKLLARFEAIDDFQPKDSLK